jgi:hypothetical protein
MSSLLFIVYRGIKKSSCSLEGAAVAQSVGLDDRGSIPIRAMMGFCLFTTASRPALRPTQPIKWVQELFPRGIKRPGREADH